MKKTVSKNGISIELNLPDDTPPGEIIRCIKEVVRIIDKFESPEEFDEFFESLVYEEKHN